MSAPKASTKPEVRPNLGTVHPIRPSDVAATRTTKAAKPKVTPPKAKDVDAPVVVTADRKDAIRQAFVHALT